ncbi:MAG: sulfur carrier protein ThiS [Bacteroidetes bacterium]|nr:sulfur carrier protein ThiS [Bacteroidota bacterium]MCL6099834.1 sulfur carrier protein ThiS [Bacteroidota bacterium]
MTLKINGNLETIDQEKITVARLLKLKNVEMPEMVSVELNGEIIEQSNYEKIEVKDSDAIEFLYFMGGGSLGI